jgi:hypothetical protein
MSYQAQIPEAWPQKGSPTIRDPWAPPPIPSSKYRYVGVKYACVRSL